MCSPGVARTKTARMKLWSALVRRSQQACGRTAPTAFAICSSADVSDQFHSDTDFDHMLDWYEDTREPTAGESSQALDVPRAYLTYGRYETHVSQREEVPMVQQLKAPSTEQEFPVNLLTG
eukprot:5226051-Prymnesium_polylepis.1